MPQNNYIENAEKWRALSDIDFITQYTKAWITFNAWYKNSYQDIHSDRDIINEIKTNPNSFRDKILSLLNDPGNDGIKFRNTIAQLHYHLERKYIYSRHKERISCHSVLIDSGNNVREELTFLRIKYEVERKGKQINLKISNSSGKEIFKHNQTNGFNEDDIKILSNFNSLSETQQSQLLYCYSKINPKVNLLVEDEDADAILCDDYKFKFDKEMLCKGLIEILYSLRNALFHGSIVPDKETRKVYEPAFNLLYMIVQSL